MAWSNIYSMALQLLYAFVTSCAGYAPFVLMNLIERWLDERKWKKLKAQQIRMREQELAEEEVNYREGDDEGQYGSQEEEEEVEVEGDYRQFYG